MGDEGEIKSKIKIKITITIKRGRVGKGNDTEVAIRKFFLCGGTKRLKAQQHVYIRIELIAWP